MSVQNYQTPTVPEGKSEKSHNKEGIIESSQPVSHQETEKIYLLYVIGYLDRDHLMKDARYTRKHEFLYFRYTFFIIAFSQKFRKSTAKTHGVFNRI